MHKQNNGLRPKVLSNKQQRGDIKILSLFMREDFYPIQINLSKGSKMATVRKTTTRNTTTGEASAWLEDNVLREKVAQWKSKGYSLDDVCMSLQARNYMLDDKQVSLKKVAHTWNAKLVEL